MLAFRGELDQCSIVDLSDFSALGSVAALVEQPAQVRTDVAQLLAEFAVRNLEATHGRPALFCNSGRRGPQFAFELGDRGARRTDLVVQSLALGIGDGAGRIFRLDLVVDERIKQELFSHVFEEVLLPPALEHAIGDIDVAQVPSAPDDPRLMAAVAQAGDLSQAQLAFEETHGLIMQKIVNRTSVEHGATADEAPLIDATAPAL